MKEALHYRAAVLGNTGRGNYGHSLDTAFVGIPNVEMVALADPDPDGRAVAAARCGAARTYADPFELLEQEKPGLVSIAMGWLDQHHDLFLAAAKVGAHILIEKPMARSLDEADRMMAAADAQGLKVAVAHQLRAFPGPVQARALLRAGAIGRLRFMRGYGKMDLRGGGLDTLILGTHQFDLMRFMTGTDPQWCLGRITQDGRDATAEDVRPGSGEVGPVAGNGLWATYGFPDGVTATYESYAGENYAGVSGPTFGLDLYGTDGILSLRTRKLYHYPRPYAGPLVDAACDVEWEEIGLPEFGQPLHSAGRAGGMHPANYLLALDLLAAVAEDREPLSSGQGARWSLEMIHAVYDAHRTGQRVSLPLDERSHPLSRWT